MAISVKLQTGLTQKLGQNLTMTPQLAQSIKLLQMSSTELLKHIDEEVERNPLLEIGENVEQDRRNQNSAELIENENPQSDLNTQVEINDQLETSQQSLEDNLGTSFENEFDQDFAQPKNYEKTPQSTSNYQETSFAMPSSIADDHNLEQYISDTKSLREHLAEQLALSRVEQTTRFLASEIIDCLDEDGFFRRELATLASEKGVELQKAVEALEFVQSMEPTGIGARDLAECLTIQLKEQNRFDPAMAKLLENLDLLAKRDFKQLIKICGVEHEDIMDMVHEIKSLDPRPARAFDHTPIQQIIPDVSVTKRADGSFAVELNAHALPKVLVNQTYQSIVKKNSGNDKDETFIVDRLQEANWLVRSLEQRAQTILKVMHEIVRQQDGFFAFGISHLKPMSLKQIADKIKMHESTVSRVTTNKYVSTDRGLFELKFFFTASIPATGDNEAHSAESVRQKIKQLIDAETVNKVLSDDALVKLLLEEGIDIARRTVAKYRESLHIASSVQRRREKKAEQLLNREN